MATSNYDNAVNYTSTDSQKECCAVIAMREAVEMLAAREKIPYEEALLRFTNSRAYEALSLISIQRFGKRVPIIF